MAEMGALVGEDVGQMGGVQGAAVEIDGRAVEAEQAGGGQVLHQIDRQSACFASGGQRDGLAFGPELEIEDEVGKGHSAAGDKDSRFPDEIQPIHRRTDLGSVLRGCGFRLVRQGEGRGKVVRQGRRDPLLHHGGEAAGRAGHAHGHGKEGAWQQQPQRSQQPQAILQAG